MEKKSRIAEAFGESFNTLGLAGVCAVALALPSALPLLVGLVVEAGYLLFVPDTSWYQKRLAKRYDAEIEKQRQARKDALLPKLRPEMRERFLRLEETRKQIDTQSQDDKTWFREVLRKLDYLLDKFLEFAGKEVQFRSYLKMLHEEIEAEKNMASSRRPADFEVRDRRADSRSGKRGSREDDRRPPIRMEQGGAYRSVSGAGEPGYSSQAGEMDDRWVQKTVEEVQASYRQERERVETLLQTEQDDNTKAILLKRTDVLKRREEFVGKIGKILLNLNHQSQLVEDTFGLINDEIRARSPEQILSDIEEVVIATDTMSSTLEELATFDQQFTARSA